MLAITNENNIAVTMNPFDVCLVPVHCKTESVNFYLKGFAVVVFANTKKSFLVVIDVKASKMWHIGALEGGRTLMTVVDGF